MNDQEGWNAHKEVVKAWSNKRADQVPLEPQNFLGLLLLLLLLLATADQLRLLA